MNRPLVAIGLVAFIPTISILFTLNYNDDETTSQIFFLACKLWLLVAPAYWYLRVEGKEISRSPADKEGLVMAASTGILMSAIIVLMWLIFGDTIDTDSMLAEMETTGLTDIRIYIAGMFYWIFLNSLLEEYVFRWFLVVKSESLVGSENAAIALSAAIFVANHTVALDFFGFPWWANLISSVAVFIGGASFSWRYVRYRSVWIPYIAHAICDVAVFGVGALILF